MANHDASPQTHRAVAEARSDTTGSRGATHEWAVGVGPFRASQRHQFPSCRRERGSGHIVVFDETYPGQCIFHGHVRTWDQLTQKMQSALYKAGLTDLKGRIL